MADAPALAEFQDIDSAGVTAFAHWMTSHAESHLPYVADLDGRTVGAAWLLIAERVPRGHVSARRHGDIQSVMVREQFRARGIGSALITALLAEARARRLTHVTVHSGRRAVAFYLRHGFTHHNQLLLWEPSSPVPPEGDSEPPARGPSRPA
ncbi:GNAT family N-acetyltransferase [Actinoplanes sp. NPDC048796]|uniref:GNAT family N-acetyltransferase n=1 Tax=unclassified Actinoplanes TaxID=2626549 RepID=UPI0033EB422B